MARAAVSVLIPRQPVGEQPQAGATHHDAEASPEPVVDRLIAGEHWRWLALTGVWLAVAFSIGFGIYVNNTALGRGTTLISAMMVTVPIYIGWTLASPMIYRALHETLAGDRRILGFAILIGWSVIALVGTSVLGYLGLAYREGMTPTLDGLISVFYAPPAGLAIQSMNASMLVLALIGLAVVRGLRVRDHALWQASRAALRHAQLEAQIAQARLQSLQSQINPHFLLNSLNAIAGLVQTGESDRAYDAVGKLGELLQTALRNGSAADMTLGQELDFLERYLKLCELRFGPRFRYRISIPEALREQRIPALVVQPLVENSIRHGMAAGRVLTVDVRAYQRGAEAVVEVEDDGRGIARDRALALPAGHGLANVAERLRLFFNGRGALQVERREPAGARVRLVFPARHPGK